MCSGRALAAYCCSGVTGARCAACGALNRFSDTRASYNFGSVFGVHRRRVILIIWCWGTSPQPQSFPRCLQTAWGFRRPQKQRCAGGTGWRQRGRSADRVRTSRRSEHCASTRGDPTDRAGGTFVTIGNAESAADRFWRIVSGGLAKLPRPLVIQYGRSCPVRELWRGGIRLLLSRGIRKPHAVCGGGHRPLAAFLMLMWPGTVRSLIPEQAASRGAC